MKINNSTKKSLLIIALAMASTTYQTQAAPIEHIDDRYIMHIPVMPRLPPFAREASFSFMA